MNHKILVVVAHPDDEILGVGGTILKHVSSGDEVSILILGEGETSRGNIADIHKREAQAKKAAEMLGVRDLVLDKLPDQRFDTLPFLEIVQKIEKEIVRIKPNVIYTHNAYDLNLDHRIIFQAALTASRPAKNNPLKTILSFETLSSTEWQIKDQTSVFLPTEYHDITDVIEKKIEIFKIYRDEVREYPHPRSEEGIRILAKYRGMESAYPYAEAFQVIRRFDD